MLQGARGLAGRQDGASAIEFAIVAPVFLLVVLGILVCAVIIDARVAPGKHAWWHRYGDLMFDVEYARHAAPEGRGYGELLVAVAADRAGSAGARAVRIGIIAENVRLSEWYHRLGFVTVDGGNRYGTLPFTVDHLELGLPQQVRLEESASVR